MQHDTALIHWTPKGMQPAGDPDDHFIHVARVSRPWRPPAQAFGKLEAKIFSPVPDSLMRDHHAALSQDQLDIAQAETDDGVQPSAWLMISVVWIAAMLSSTDRGISPAPKTAAAASASLADRKANRCRGSGGEVHYAGFGPEVHNDHLKISIGKPLCN